MYREVDSLLVHTADHEYVVIDRRAAILFLDSMDLHNEGPISYLGMYKWVLIPV